ncbi:hypothetical protein ElyMa_001624200 [Elysia marginata]|uniref:Uncharacterized protein n=1 Tax=Elysia marginata TaxID=1093978 RepID=A0AAV4JQE1_9GAST|nr:hypothetical protein ElyMa_001624200 [Elysia marginata]
MPIRYDTSNIINEYCMEVSNKFEALNATTEEMRPEELANKAKEIFTEASKHLKIVIKDENGNVLTESRQILDRWKRCSENMFANTSEPKQTAVDNNENYTDTYLEPPRSEVEWAINSLKDGKSPG